MIRNKKFVIVLSGSLLLVLFGISIAYAALSQTLTTTYNRISQSSQTWNIGFVSGTITGQVVTNSSNSLNCGTATATATTISGISPTLSDVGDKCSYTFTIKNDGSIDGKISSITITEPLGQTCTKTGSTMVCGNITYMLHYDSANSSTLVSVNNVIEKKNGSTATTKTVVMTIEYTGTTAAEEDFTQSGFSYSLLYAQY